MYAKSVTKVIVVKVESVHFHMDYVRTQSSKLGRMANTSVYVCTARQVWGGKFMGEYTDVNKADTVYRVSV